MLKILLLDHFNRHGGAQEYALEIARQLNLDGHICYLPQITLPSLLEKAAKIPMLRGSISSKSPFLLFKNIHILKKSLHSKKIDIIHCNSIPALLVARFIANKQPIFFTAHDSHLPRIKQLIIKLCSEHIISVSQSVKNDAQSSGITTPNHVVYNGLFDFTIPHTQRLNCRVALPGRIEEKKGVDIFIQAAQKLYTIFPEVQFDIYGYSESPEYQKYLTELIGNNEQIKIKPFCNNKKELFDSVDIVVNSSRYIEPLGRTLIEAGIVSLPVIGPNIGGPLEIINDGVSGFLFKSGDYEDLAEKISLLLESPELRKSMGREGRRIYEEKFKINCIIKQIVVLYETALNIK